jgi:hypothetical protein
MWRQQAEVEGLTLLEADNKAGYYGVHLNKPGQPKPYQAKVRRGGKKVGLGSFATVEEAALCVARTPEGRAAAEKAAPPLMSEEARQQAQAEGLTLLKAYNKTKTGYYGVYLKNPGYPKPYQAYVSPGGNKVSLGSFATAEEAALCVARSQERRVAAKRAAPQLSEEEGKGTVLPMPPARRVRRQGGGRASSRSRQAKEEGRSGSRPKRQRRK